MRTNRPKVSIIIPAYNCERYIAAAIQSCINQNYENLEIIVINDGATDNTKDIIEAFNSDSRVKLFNQTNRGVSAARNLGIEQASGEFITFLDADDELSPETLLHNIELISNHNEIEWLFFPIQRIGKDGEVVNEISSKLLPSFIYDKIEIITTSEAFERMSRRQLPSCACGIIYRHNFLDIKFKEGRFEDTIMVMELLRKRSNIMISPHGAYLYYDRKDSFINSAWGSDKWISYINVLLETMQTKKYLFLDKTNEIEKGKTRIYYNLRYLKAINRGKQDFDLPLNYFLSKVGNVKPSIFGWCRYALKIVLYKCKMFVIPQ